MVLPKLKLLNNLTPMGGGRDLLKFRYKKNGKVESNPSIHNWVNIFISLTHFDT